MWTVWRGRRSIDHLLLRCPSSRSVWYGSPLRLDTQGLPFSIFKEVLWSRFEICPPDYMSLWNFRNRKYFEGKNFSFTDVINKVQSEWSGNEEQEAVPKRGMLQQINESWWKKPEIGKMKLNSDVAFWPDGRTGMGFVLRDHTGGVVLAGKSECRAAGSTALLEGRHSRLLVDVEGESIVHIPRQANQAAHKLVHGSDLISIQHTPEQIVSLIANDVID